MKFGGKIETEENSTDLEDRIVCIVKDGHDTGTRENKFNCGKLDAFLLEVYTVQELAPGQLNMESRIKIKGNGIEE